MATRNKTRVFISYARTDGEGFAGDLRARLEKEHPEITLWQDRVKMEGGRDWWLQITEAIQQVEFMVLIMTPAALASKTVQREWRYARSQGVCIYPVKAAPDLDFSHLPKWMSSVHWYDLDREWSKFINDLNTRCVVAKVPFMAEEMPSDFVERPAEFDALKSALLEPERGDPVAITAALRGAGGFGKTTLAKALCHDDDLQTAFDDGILWVTLGENPNVLEGLNTLINALSPEHLSINNFEEAILKLGDLLTDRDCLIVIDDVWDSNHLRPFLRNGPRCARLVTTRLNDVLPPDSPKIKVDAMLPSEAMQLLQNGVVPSGDKSAGLDFRSLAKRLGEWPLLLKLANGAMRRRMETGESSAQAMAWVEKALTRKGFKALDDPGSKEDRHRAVAVTLQVSLELLSDTEFHHYARLAIFPEDVDVPLVTLEKLWEMDDFDTDELCGRFFGLSLLLNFDRSADTIRLHDVVRKFLQDEHQSKLKGWHETFLAHWRTAIGKWADLPSSEPYLWDWLAYHLVEAEQGDELTDLLASYEFLQRKLQARHIYSVISDFDFAPQTNDYEELMIIKLALLRSAHILVFRPQELSIQLYGRLLSKFETMPSIRNLITTVKSSLSLVPITQSHDQAGDSIESVLVHDAAIWSVVWSPDGKLVVSGSEDGVLRLWNALNGTFIRNLAVFPSTISNLSWIPNSVEALIAFSVGNQIIVFNVEEGLTRAEVKFDTIESIAWSPDGKKLVFTSHDGTLIWELKSGEYTLIAKRGTEGALWSPDGKYIAFVSGLRIFLWDVFEREVIRTFVGHKMVPDKLAWSPDNKQLFSGDFGGTIIMWEVETGTQIWKAHYQIQAEAVDYSPDGQYVLSSSLEYILVLNANDGEPVRVLIGHSGGFVPCARWSYDGSRIISCSSDGQVIIWNAHKGHSFEAKAHLGRVNFVEWSTNGQFLASGSEAGTLQIFEIATKESIYAFEKDNENCLCGAWSPSNQVMALSVGGQLVVWSLASQSVRRINQESKGVAWSPHAEEIAIISGELILHSIEDHKKTALNIGELTIYNLSTDNILSSIGVNRGMFTSIAWSYDGKYIAVGTDEGAVIIWDYQNYGIYSLIEEKWRINHIKWSHKNNRLAIASGRVTSGGAITVWDLDTGSKSMRIVGHTASCNSVDWSLDDAFIISVGSDFSANIWDSSMGDHVTGFTADFELTCCAWSPDGQFIAIGDEKGRVILLEVHL